MGNRPVSINLNPGTREYGVSVDGERLRGVSGLTLTHNAGESMPKLILDFVLWPIEVEGRLFIAIPDDTRASLIALGWTPPAEDLTPSTAPIDAAQAVEPIDAATACPTCESEEPTVRGLLAEATGAGPWGYSESECQDDWHDA